MIKLILSLTILVTTQASFAQIGQKGCNDQMVAEAQNIKDLSQQAYENGMVQSTASFRADINLMNTKNCAGKISKKDACSAMKSTAAQLVTAEMRELSINAASFGDVISSTQLKNEIEIYCQK